MDGAVVHLLRLLELSVASLEPPILHPCLRVLRAALRQFAVQPLNPLHRLISFSLLFLLFPLFLLLLVGLLGCIVREGSQPAILVLDALAENLGPQGNQHFVLQRTAAQSLATILQVLRGAQTRNALLVAVGEIQNEHGNVQLGSDQKHFLAVISSFQNDMEQRFDRFVRFVNRNQKLQVAHRHFQQLASIFLVRKPTHSLLVQIRNELYASPRLFALTLRVRRSSSIRNQRNVPSGHRNQKIHRLLEGFDGARQQLQVLHHARHTLLHLASIGVEPNERKHDFLGHFLLRLRLAEERFDRFIKRGNIAIRRQRRRGVSQSGDQQRENRGRSGDIGRSEEFLAWRGSQIETEAACCASCRAMKRASSNWDRFRFAISSDAEEEEEEESRES